MHTHMHAPLQPHSPAHAYTLTLTPTHTCVHPLAYTNIQTHIPTCTHMHTCVHTSVLSTLLLGPLLSMPTSDDYFFDHPGRGGAPSPPLASPQLPSCHKAPLRQEHQLLQLQPRSMVQGVRDMCLDYHGPRAPWSSSPSCEFPLAALGPLAFRSCQWLGAETGIREAVGSLVLSSSFKPRVSAWASAQSVLCLGSLPLAGCGAGSSKSLGLWEGRGGGCAGLLGGGRADLSPVGGRDQAVSSS